MTTILLGIWCVPFWIAKRLADKFCIAGSGQLWQPDPLYRVLGDSRRLQVLFHCCKIKKKYIILLNVSIVSNNLFKVHVFVKVVLCLVQLLHFIFFYCSSFFNQMPWLKHKLDRIQKSKQSRFGKKKNTKQILTFHHVEHISFCCRNSSI